MNLKFHLQINKENLWHHQFFFSTLLSLPQGFYWDFYPLILFWFNTRQWVTAENPKHWFRRGGTRCSKGLQLNSNRRHCGYVACAVTIQLPMYFWMLFLEYITVSHMNTYIYIGFTKFKKGFSNHICQCLVFSVLPFFTWSSMSRCQRRQTFFNTLNSVLLLQSEQQTRQQQAEREHHEERKKLRRSAGHLSSGRGRGRGGGRGRGRGRGRYWVHSQGLHHGWNVDTVLL